MTGASPSMHDGAHERALADLQQQLADRHQQIADLTSELARWEKAPHFVALAHRDAEQDLLLLLRDCRIALTDRLHTYAHELCEAEQVQNSAQRIREQGGTLADIAQLLDRMNRTGIVSIAARQPAEQSSLNAIDKSVYTPSSVVRRIAHHSLAATVHAAAH